MAEQDETKDTKLPDPKEARLPEHTMPVAEDALEANFFAEKVNYGHHRDELTPNGEGANRVHTARKLYFEDDGMEIPKGEGGYAVDEVTGKVVRPDEGSEIEEGFKARMAGTVAAAIAAEEEEERPKTKASEPTRAEAEVAQESTVAQTVPMAAEQQGFEPSGLELDDDTPRVKTAQTAAEPAKQAPAARVEEDVPSEPAPAQAVPAAAEKSDESSKPTPEAPEQKQEQKQEAAPAAAQKEGFGKKVGKAAIAVALAPVTMPIGLVTSIGAAATRGVTLAAKGAGHLMSYAADIAALPLDAVGKGGAALGHAVESGIKGLSEKINDMADAHEGNGGKLLLKRASMVVDAVAGGVGAMTKIPEAVGWVADKVHEGMQFARDKVTEADKYVSACQGVCGNLMIGRVFKASDLNEKLKKDEWQETRLEGKHLERWKESHGKGENKAAEAPAAEAQAQAAAKAPEQEQAQEKTAEREVRPAKEATHKRADFVMSREDELAHLQAESKKFKENDIDLAVDMKQVRAERAERSAANYEFNEQVRAAAPEQKIELDSQGVANDEFKTERAIDMQVRIAEQGIENKYAPVLDLQEFKEAKAGLADMDASAEVAPRATTRPRGRGPEVA